MEVLHGYPANPKSQRWRCLHAHRRPCLTTALLQSNGTKIANSAGYPELLLIDLNTVFLTDTRQEKPCTCLKPKPGIAGINQRKDLLYKQKDLDHFS
jgi:hypothetical protein